MVQGSGSTLTRDRLRGFNASGAKAAGREHPWKCESAAGVARSPKWGGSFFGVLARGLKGC